MPKSIEECLTGSFLYGDDFPAEAVDRWFQEETSACYDIRQTYPPGYRYPYHALRWEHGFRHLPPARKFDNVLGYGAGPGEEFEPIRSRCGHIAIIEPSEGYANNSAKYYKPMPDGTLQFPGDTFDLITCFGVLHHICNAGKAFRELTRCLAHDGYLLIDEPVISMGNWKSHRPGLSKNERGIPLNVFRAWIAESGLRVVKEIKCEFHLWAHVPLIGKGFYNRRFCVSVDDALCKFLPYHYHATTWLEKIRFGSVSYVLHKR